MSGCSSAARLSRLPRNQKVSLRQTFYHGTSLGQEQCKSRSKKRQLTNRSCPLRLGVRGRENRGRLGKSVT